ncbi:MAG: thiamine pyrophosphate-binding protein [Rhodospirillales bacterium]
MNDMPRTVPTTPDETPVNLPANRSEAAYVSDAMVDVMAALGFDYVFLLPGSTFRGLHDSLVNHGRNIRPKIILATHEGAAIAMAHGYAKAKGRSALAVVHDLVGLMHGSMMVYNAWCDRTPVVVLGGAGPIDPAERRFIDWVHSASTQSDIVKPWVKWTDEPPTGSATLESIARANRIAQTYPRGPVYVSVDCAVQETAIDASLAVPELDHPRYRPAAPVAPNPGALAQAAEALVGARQPLVIGGRFGIRRETGAPLQALVEALGAAYRDDHNIVCMPTAHPQNLNGDAKILGESDVVISFDVQDLNALLGMYSSRRSSIAGAAGAAQRPTVIDVSMTEYAVNAWAAYGGPMPPVDIQLNCEPALGLAMLLDAVKARLASDATARQRIAARTEALAARHKALRAAQRARWDKQWDRSPVIVPRLTEAVYQAVKGKDYVLLGRSIVFPEGLWQFDGAGRFLGSSGGGGVGYGPGASVGAALALRDEGKFAVSILGDGDFVMYPGALWTAVHYRIPLLVVVNNNSTWGNDEQHQIEVAHHRSRPAENAWIGQRMPDPAIDFATVARGFGAWAEGPIAGPGELEAALRRAVAEVEQGRVAVLDVRTVPPLDQG